MRNELLHGYVLHSRPYREKSRILQFYSLEHGRLDGVIRQTPPPLYQSCVAMVSGKSALKSFTQVEQIGTVHTLTGASLIAGFYLNELLVKLLALNDTSAAIFAAYTCAIADLAAVTTLANPQLGLVAVLRRFEYELLLGLGYAVNFDSDVLAQPINADAYYRYTAGEGFVKQATVTGEHGAVLLAMQDDNSRFSPETLPMLSRVFRVSIAALLGHQPLKSRELWVSNR